MNLRENLQLHRGNFTEYGYGTGKAISQTSKNFCKSFLSLITLNPLSANPTKWSNTLKQLLGKLPTDCLSVSDHFVKLALKGLKLYIVQDVCSTG